MEPLSDRDLDKLLREWQAPSAPETLKRRVLAQRRGAWWKWLWTGSIRVPVPVTLMLIAAFVVMAILALRTSRQPSPGQLQPVKRFEVRIIRSKYENNN